MQSERLAQQTVGPVKTRLHRLIGDTEAKGGILDAQLQRKCLRRKQLDGFGLALKPSAQIRGEMNNFSPYSPRRAFRLTRQHQPLLDLGPHIESGYNWAQFKT